MDMSVIGAIATSLRTAGEIANAMLQLRDAEAFRTKAVELLGQIITAQSSTIALQAEHAALISRIRELEEKLVKMEDWNVEKERYELASLAPGTFAYIVKETMRRGSPPHAICANCYENGVKSVLQTFKTYAGEAHITCPRCKHEMQCGTGTFPIPI